MKTSRLILFGIVLLLSAALSACAGGGAAATSWPGVSVDLERDAVYVAHNTHIYALNLGNGSERWRFPAEADNKITFFAAPAVGGDQLVVGGYDNVLYSLDPGNGAQQWAFVEAQNRYVADPLIANEKVYAPNSDNILYALDQKGLKQWTASSEHAMWGATVSDGERVYQVSMDHYVYALDAQSGESLWKSDDLGGAIAGTPTLSEDGLLYVGTFGSELVALETELGREVWRFPTTGWVWTGPAIDGEKLYFGDLNGALYCANAADGSIEWQVQPNSEDKRAISDRPLVVDDTLYFVDESGNLFAIDTQSGTTRWRITIEGRLYTSPVIAGDLILVAAVDADAILYAVDTNGNRVWEFTPAK